jgi:hypothetical protein
MKDREQMNAQIELQEAVATIESHGITLPDETKSELKGRQFYLTGLLEPMRLAAKEKSEKIAAAYRVRDNLRNSAIFFMLYPAEIPSAPTVIIPSELATFDETVCLLNAIRKIVSYDEIIIDDPYD